MKNVLTTFGIIFLGILVLVVLVRTGDDLTERKLPSTFRVVKDERMEPYKRSVVVRLAKPASEEELKNLAFNLLARDEVKYQPGPLWNTTYQAWRLAPEPGPLLTSKASRLM